ncbi:MAG: DUF1249 domain-containing protein [Thiogranum sp.]
MRYSGKYKVHPGVRARDLPALMELYELNYIQLRRLVPDINAIQDDSVSRVHGALNLYLTVSERSKYTTTFHLSYQFNDKDGDFPAPDLVVRMYHDAQVAEVISRGRRRGRREAEYDRFQHRYDINTKWQVNRFLHKWLGYCLHQGHAFSPAREQLAEVLRSIEDEQALSLES